MLMEPSKIFALVLTLLPLGLEAVANDQFPRNYASCEAIASPSSNSICGKPTDPSSTGSVGTQTLDFDTCIDYAFINQFQGISYNNQTNICRFFAGSGFHSNRTSTALYYDISDCFSCSLDCNVSPSTNILPNPNFSDSNTSISPWSDSAMISQIIPNPVGEGNALLYTGIVADYTTLAVILGQGPTFCPGTGHLFSVDYKIDQSLPAPDLPEPQMASAFKFYSATTGCVETKTFVFSDERFGKWQRLECGFRTETSATQKEDSGGLNLEIQLLGYATDRNGNPVTWNLTLANPRLSRLSAAPIKTKGESIVRNGGFENSELVPWVSRASYLRDRRRKEPMPCKEGERLTSIVSPGLPAQANTTQASKYHLSFCGISKSPNYYRILGDYYSSVTYYLKQEIARETVPGKLYVVTLQYTAQNATQMTVSYDDVQFSPSAITTGTAVYQGVFVGSGKASNLTISAGGSGSFERDSMVPPYQLSFAIDNISISLANEE